MKILTTTTTNIEWVRVPTPQELKALAELIHWLKNDVKQWEGPIDARNISTDRELGTKEGKKFAALEIATKLEELGI